MTDTPSDSSDRDEIVSTQFLDAVSRRTALGSGAFAAATALGGCLSIDQYFGQDDPQPDQDTEMWDTESRVRQSKHGDVDGSFRPQFEYEPVEVAVEEPEEEPVTRVVAAPAEEDSGDRAAMECRSSEADAVATLLVLFWAHPEQETSIDVRLSDQSIRFQVFTGSNIALAIATRSLNAAADRSEILLTRATDVSTVESLATDFDRLYG